MPRAKKTPPADLRIARVFATESLYPHIVRSEHFYVTCEPWPLTHEFNWTSKQQSVFFDTCFGVQEGCDFAKKMHVMHSEALFLTSSTDLRGRLAERHHSNFASSLTPVTSVRIYGFGALYNSSFNKVPTRSNILLRINTPSFYPLPASLNHPDPLYSGQWVDPLKGANPQQDCLWWRSGIEDENLRAMLRLWQWGESALARKREVRELGDFLSAAVNYASSTDALFKALPGLRQVVGLYAGDEIVERATQKRAGGGHFDAIGMRSVYPLWASEWTEKHRPVLIGITAAGQAQRPAGMPEKLALVSHIPA